MACVGFLRGTVLRSAGTSRLNARATSIWSAQPRPIGLTIACASAVASSTA